MKLHEIATARAGDKGDTAQIAVIAKDAPAFAWLREHLTTGRVAQAFVGIANGPITRHEAANLRALVFLLPGALGGGVSISLASDPHGKSLSSLMLMIELGEID
jgi:hypothetical protein